MENKNNTTKKGMAGQPPAVAIKPFDEADYRSIIDHATMEGIHGCLSRFLHARKVEPNDDKLLRFTTKVTEEFAPEHPKAWEFCLPESIKTPVLAALSEADPTLRALYRGDTKEHFVSTVRVIVAGEVIKVLDKHPGKALEAFMAS